MPLKKVCKMYRHLWVLALLLAPQMGFAAPAAPAAPVEAPPSIPIAAPGERIYTDEEVRLLQDLEKRRVDLDRREEAIRVREKLVDLAQARLDSRIERLAKLQDNIEKLLKDLSGKEEGELEALARIYEKMKPAAAAEIFNALDPEIVYDLVRRMKQADTAKIMEKMAPPRARLISQMLAERSPLPDF